MYPKRTKSFILEKTTTSFGVGFTHRFRAHDTYCTNICDLFHPDDTTRCKTALGNEKAKNAIRQCVLSFKLHHYDNISSNVLNCIFARFKRELNNEKKLVCGMYFWTIAPSVRIAIYVVEATAYSTIQNGPEFHDVSLIKHMRESKLTMPLVVTKSTLVVCLLEQYMVY